MVVLKVILIIIAVVVAIVVFCIAAVIWKIRSFAKKVKGAVEVHEALSSGLSVAEAAQKLGIKEKKVEEIAQYLRDNPKALAAVELIIAAKKESERQAAGGDANGPVIDGTATVVDVTPLEPQAPLLTDGTANPPAASDGQAPADVTPPPGPADGSTSDNQKPTN